MIKLVAMSQEDYKDYLARAVKDYAHDKVKAGTWQPDEADRLSRESFQSLLPEGPNTDGEYLFSITLESKVIGYTWLHRGNGLKPSAFIYDLSLFEHFQKKGYGTQVMQLLYDIAKELDCVKISLHVFAHNQAAVNLYKKSGYEFTDFSMSKSIK